MMTRDRWGRVWFAKTDGSVRHARLFFPGGERTRQRGHISWRLRGERDRRSGVALGRCLVRNLLRRRGGLQSVDDLDGPGFFRLLVQVRTDLAHASLESRIL